MTLSARHKTIWGLFALSVILNGIILYFLAVHLQEMEQYHPLSLIRQSRWLGTGNGSPLPFGRLLLLHGASSSLPLLASLVLILCFRHSSSQEIFYFQLFLLSLSLISIRLYSYGAAWYHLPFSVTVRISRAVLFFRFSGLLFLLLSGISVFDNRIQKSDPFFPFALVVSFGLAATIPVSSRFIQNTLTYLPVNELSLFFLFLIIKLIIPINFLWFFYQRKTIDYFILTTATILCITGETLLFYMTFYSCVGGLILLLSGTILFSHRIYKLYLWR